MFYHTPIPVPPTTARKVIFTRVGSHVPLQFVSVPAGVAAQAALEWTLSSVRAYVAFQLADLNSPQKEKKD